MNGCCEPLTKHVEPYSGQKKRPPSGFSDSGPTINTFNLWKQTLPDPLLLSINELHGGKMDD